MLKHALTALALAAATASAQSQTLISEGFDNVATLAGSGWSVLNNSSPAGSIANWFQGDQNQFAAQAGSANSYVAANFNMAAVGGTLDAWLVSPLFSRSTDVTVSFYARAAADIGFSDSIAQGVSSNGGVAPFAMLAPTVVGSAGWNLYSVNLASTGAGTTGRFAIQYTGAADTSNYLGIDSFTVTAVNAVPEPASALMLAAGLLGLVGLRTRRAR